MGNMTREEGEIARRNALNWLTQNYDLCIDGSLNDFTILIIVIAQLLYGIYCTFGRLRNQKYHITADILQNAIDSKYSALAHDIVSLRNDICHNSGDSYTDALLQDMLLRKAEIHDLLVFLQVIKETDFSKMENEEKVIYILDKLGCDTTKSTVKSCMSLLTDNMYEDEEVLESAVKTIMKV